MRSAGHWGTHIAPPKTTSRFTFARLLLELAETETVQLFYGLCGPLPTRVCECDPT